LPADGWSAGLGREPVSDRVQIDQGGGPEGLQAGLGGTDVAGLAVSLAVGEQAEQPLDPGAGATQVPGGGWVVERLAGGDEELLGGDEDLLVGGEARGSASAAASRFIRAP
jgi:hypothetical protein